MSKLFSSLSFKDLVFVVIVILVVGASIHFVVSNPMGPSRIFYQMEAQLARWTTTCSDEAPQWMPLAMHKATKQLGALTSQMAYIQPSGMLHHCETGWVDGVFGSERTSSENRFRYASVTKLFTADAVIELINQNRLSLDDSAFKIIHGEGYQKVASGPEITIGHLLTHRGGWDREKIQDEMFLLNRKPWCPYDMSQFDGSGLSFPPGERTSYSNLGYCVLGVVIERVSEVPYRKYVLDEYGSRHNSLKFVDGPYLSNEVDYDFRHEEFYTKDYYKRFDFKAASAAAGLSGNAIDLALSVKEMAGRHPLNILSDQADECDSSKMRDCFGLAVYKYQPFGSNLAVFVQDGLLPGNQTFAWVDSNGGVLVWLGGGKPLNALDKRERFYSWLIPIIEEYYLQEF